jgi:hypothetical protein
VKITRIVEMDLPVPLKAIRQATAAELRKSAWLYPHFVSEDDTTPILVIGTHFAAPTAGHVVRDGAAFRFAV